MDPLAEKFYDISSYAYVSNNPINAIDPDGRDIIVLQAKNSVHGLGHAAVLIGNDIDGWKYVSKNGTTKDLYGRFGTKGPSINPNLGLQPYDPKIGNGDDFTQSELSIYEIFDVINDKRRSEDKYTAYFRIKTTPEQDEQAILAAMGTAVTEYRLVGNSCVDVCQNAIKSTGIEFKEPSFLEPRPNLWIEKFQKYNWYNQETTPITRNKTATLEIGDLTIKKIDE